MGLPGSRMIIITDRWSTNLRSAMKHPSGSCTLAQPTFDIELNPPLMAISQRIM